MTLPQLLKRVSEAEGPDRELDGMIALDVAGAKRFRNWYDDPETKQIHAWHVLWKLGAHSEDGWEPLPRYTEDLNAAITLALKATPDALLGCSTEWDSEVGFDNDIPGGQDTPRWNAWCYGESASHPTSPALAILAALLKAKIAEAQQ